MNKREVDLKDFSQYLRQHLDTLTGLRESELNKCMTDAVGKEEDRFQYIRQIYTPDGWDSLTNTSLPFSDSLLRLCVVNYMEKMYASEKDKEGHVYAIRPVYESRVGPIAQGLIVGILVITTILFISGIFGSN